MAHQFCAFACDANGVELQQLVQKSKDFQARAVAVVLCGKTTQYVSFSISSCFDFAIANTEILSTEQETNPMLASISEAKIARLMYNHARSHNWRLNNHGLSTQFREYSIQLLYVLWERTMNFFLKLPRTEEQFVSGDIVQIVDQSSYYLCRVIKPYYCVVPSFGTFIKLGEKISSSYELVDFALFQAQKIQCNATTRGFIKSDQVMLTLLRNCPIANNCLLDGSVVHCSGKGSFCELEHQDFPLVIHQVPSFAPNRLAQLIAKLQSTHLLLSGPQGSGKTTLLIQAAQSLNLNFEFVEDFNGLDKSSKSLLIFRNLDLVAPSRSEFCTQEQIENCTKLLKFFNVFKGHAAATCESAEKIDLALRRPGRFGCEVINQLPNEKERENILQEYDLKGEMLILAIKKTFNCQYQQIIQVGESYQKNQKLLIPAPKSWLESFQPQIMKCEGFDEQKKQIIDNFMFYANDVQQCKLLGVLPDNVLITGRPCSGKTTLLNEVCLVLQEKYQLFQLKAHQILSMYVGESEINLRKLFRFARQLAPSIIIIENIDEIFSDREVLDCSNRLLTTLLAEMDGANENQDVFVIATNTNAIDNALTRFGRLGMQVKVDFKSLQQIGDVIFDFGGSVVE